VTKLRIVFGTLLALACGACNSSAPESDAEWGLYKQRYISPEGRVIDTGNVDVSHSEGQGIGLLLSVHHKDRAAFDSIWQWTRTNLQTRPDKLFSWKWVPSATGGSKDDPNNATDGDLFIAWALYRAGRQWSEASYLAAAKEISRDIRAKLLRPSPYGLLLLPGEQGFVKEGQVTVNLSYWMFPALQDLNRLDPAPEWGQLIESGLKLLQTGRFGRWQLPSDWLRLADKPEIPPDFKPRFGYDAIRIPLYLIWAKLDTPDNLKPFNDFWGYFKSAPFIPAWSNLTDDSVDSYNAFPGIQAIISLAGLPGPARVESHKRLRTKLGADQAYYSASLLLLSEMAALESIVK
jgi:endoglucanase